jgi:hypothetical protein
VAGFIPRTFFHIFFLLGPDSATFERIMFNLAKDALKIVFALNGTSVLEMPLGGAPLCALFEPHGPLERRFKLVTNVDTGDDERKFLKGAKCKACKKETTKTARFVWFGHLGGEQSDPGGVRLGEMHRIRYLLSRRPENMARRVLGGLRQL